MANKFCFLPYDMDTAIGINNEGGLVFGYELEDTDTLSNSANVFNGQNSVLWCNLRDAYGDDIAAMYRDLRQKGLLSYEVVENMFEQHQAKWCEAIFNEDAMYKYINPLLEENDSSYLSMLQGSKESQRKWWLYNRFRYLDSKYNAGDALTDVITLRGYAKSNITVKPYADIYASVKYGSYLVQQRALRSGGENGYTLVCPLDNVNDTEIYIYSASQLKDIGDLSGLKVGYADFTHGKNLQQIILGNILSSYTNDNLTELYIGNNTLLKKLQCANCPNLKQAIDMSGCTNVEEIDFSGTAITGVSLPRGGILKVLKLPSTITALTLRNQQALTTLSIASYSNLTSVWLENNNSVVSPYTILNGLNAGTRIRFIGVSWSFNTATSVLSVYDKLDSMRGIDANGNNTDVAQVAGTVHLTTALSSQIQEMQRRYPDIKVTCDTIANAVEYYNEDGSTLLYTDTVQSGNNSSYGGNTPRKTSTAQYSYSHIGWSTKPNSLSVEDDCQKNITKTTKLYAVFSATLRTYTVRFYNGNTLLQTTYNVPYGTTPTYTKTTPTSSDGGEFIGWSPALGAITGDTSYYAQFEIPYEYKEISDSWDIIYQSIDNGTYKTRYKVGNYKTIDMGTLGIIGFVIIGIDKDTMEDGTLAPLTFFPESMPLDSPLLMIPYTSSANLNDNTLIDSEHKYKEPQLLDGKPVRGTGMFGIATDLPLYYMLPKIKEYLPASIKERLKSVYKPYGSYATEFSDGSTFNDVPTYGGYFDVWFLSPNDLSDLDAYSSTSERVEYRSSYPLKDSGYVHYQRYQNMKSATDSVGGAIRLDIGSNEYLRDGTVLLPTLCSGSFVNFDSSQTLDDSYLKDCYARSIIGFDNQRGYFSNMKTLQFHGSGAYLYRYTLLLAFGFCIGTKNV